MCMFWDAAPATAGEAKGVEFSIKKSYFSTMPGTGKRLKAKASLTYKLTAYFVIFGVIIGYLVFISSTILGGLRFLEHFSSSVLNDTEIENIDLENFDKENFKTTVTRILTNIETENLPIREIKVYIGESGAWEQFSYTDGRVRTEAFDIGVDENLIKAKQNGVHFTNPLFFGKTDSTTVYVGVSVDERNEILVSATILRQGIGKMIEENRTEFIIFDIVLILVSLLLGKLFASSIIKPIRKLAVSAERVADGEQNIDLKLKRRDEIGVLSRVLAGMNSDLSERLKAMEIMNKIDKAVLSSISRNDLLNRVVGFICEYIDKSTAVMALRDEKGEGFELASAVSRSETALMIEDPYIADALIGPEALKLLTKPGVFTLDNSVTEVIIRHLKLPGNTRRFYNIPIHQKEVYLGSLLVIKADQSPFSEEQQLTLRKLGDQAGVALQSVMAVEEMNSLQIGSIRALSHTIDTKSRWTAGHSERVAELSELLGIEAGLGEQDIRRLVISALLHDIGKIGVSETILDKPGKLTEEEFSIIRQHPETGYEISKNIPNYEDICDGIRYHHERWNGSGYPAGLREKNIPLFGRILAIADVFDALSADRPYRRGMSPEECRRFISERKGTDFDPELAEKFLSVLKTSNKYLHNSSQEFTL